MQSSSTGNVAVVTGATGGIGKEIARGLAKGRDDGRDRCPVAPVVMQVDTADLACQELERGT